MVWLGNLSFPIFIVHGPLGQVFYKKLIAKKVFGKVLQGPVNFGLYLAATVCYDPAAAKRVFSAMKQASDGSSSSGTPSEFLSTHSSHDSRISNFDQCLLLKQC